MILSISGDPIYLVEGTTNQSHQANIDSILEPSDPKIIFIDSTIRTLHTNTAPKTLWRLLASVPTNITLKLLLFNLNPLYTNIFNNSFNHPSLLVKSYHTKPLLIYNS